MRKVSLDKYQPAAVQLARHLAFAQVDPTEIERRTLLPAEVVAYVIHRSKVCARKRASQARRAQQAAESAP